MPSYLLSFPLNFLYIYILCTFFSSFFSYFFFLTDLPAHRLYFVITLSSSSFFSFCSLLCFNIFTVYGFINCLSVLSPLYFSYIWSFCSPFLAFPYIPHSSSPFPLLTFLPQTFLPILNFISLSPHVVIPAFSSLYLSCVQVRLAESEREKGSLQAELDRFSENFQAEQTSWLDEKEKVIRYVAYKEVQ